MSLKYCLGSRVLGDTLGSKSQRQLQHHLLGVPFSKFFEYRCLILIHRVVNRKLPNYICSKFSFGRSARLSNLTVPQARTEHYRKSVVVRGSILWNSLPHSLRLVRSETTFKTKCKAYINASYT